jgi:hypothetical protein
VYVFVAALVTAEAERVAAARRVVVSALLRGWRDALSHWLGLSSDK